MEERKIYCKPCGKFLGVIRDANLYKKIVSFVINAKQKELHLI